MSGYVPPFTDSWYGGEPEVSPKDVLLTLSFLTHDDLERLMDDFARYPDDDFYKDFSKED